VSVYIDRGARRRGVGRLLLTALETAARTARLGVLLARVGGDSAASLALHAALGYRRLCTMQGVGEKHGRLLDIELLELRLDR
jgi:L-amino acid N-acyltransferase YncA